jgi:hypothetical protein
MPDKTSPLFGWSHPDLLEDLAKGHIGGAT